MPSVIDRLVAALVPGLARLRADVDALQAQMGDVMATQDQFVERMNQMDAATDEIAGDLQTLRDEVAGGTISEANLAVLDAKIARLQALGKDPENPVPTV